MCSWMVLTGNGGLTPACRAERQSRNACQTSASGRQHRHLRISPVPSTPSQFFDEKALEYQREQAKTRRYLCSSRLQRDTSSQLKLNLVRGGSRNGSWHIRAEDWARSDHGGLA